MNLEGSLLNEMSDRKRQILFVACGIKKAKQTETEQIRLVVAQGMGNGANERRWVQTSSYKTSKFWDSNIKPGDCS